MGKEAVAYLDVGIQEIVAEYVADVVPHVERHPKLQQTDLVIEGGVGNGIIAYHISRWLFPAALYAGTDIADAFLGRQPRLRGEIPIATVQDLTEASLHPHVDMRGETTLYANCFDRALIANLSQIAERQNPTLITFNALPAILNHKANPWDRKDRKDIVGYRSVVDRPGPYHAQVHFGMDWQYEDPQNAIGRPYCDLEAEAQSAGWTVERFSYGLILVDETT